MFADKNNPNNAHFHRLPKSGCLRRIWLEKCGRPGGHDEEARVCSLHFSKEDYDNVRLRQGLQAVSVIVGVILMFLVR